MKFWFLPSSQISGRMYNKVRYVKSVSLPDLQTIIHFKWKKQGSLICLGLSEDGACTDLFENLSVNSLKRDLSNATTFNPPLFSLVNNF